MHFVLDEQKLVPTIFFTKGRLCMTDCRLTRFCDGKGNASVAIFFLISNKCWFAVCTCVICIPTILLKDITQNNILCFWKLIVIKIGIQFLMTLCFSFLWNIHMQLVLTNNHDDTSPVFSCCADSLF